MNSASLSDRRPAISQIFEQASRGVRTGTAQPDLGERSADRLAPEKFAPNRDLVQIRIDARCADPSADRRIARPITSRPLVRLVAEVVGSGVYHDVSFSMILAQFLPVNAWTRDPISGVGASYYRPIVRANLALRGCEK